MNRRAALLVTITSILCACAPLDPLESPGERPAPSSEGAEGDARGEQTGSGTTSSPDQPTPDRDDPSTASSEEPGDRPETAAPTPAATDDITLSGRITLTGGDADRREAVVYFIPEDGIDESDFEDGRRSAEIVTRDKVLEPTVLAVSRGTEVHFPNEDPILHNLFSVSSDNEFDLGVYGPDESPSVTLEQPGVVNIYCNVHHDMHAHVLVVDTPWRTRADADGRFQLNDLPAGPGRLHIWHRQSDRWARSIQLPASDTVQATLEVTRPRLPAHRDKAGQPYNRRDRDPYR